jgi:hypothetical protein
MPSLSLVTVLQLGTSLQTKGLIIPSGLGMMWEAE